jgi:hypothetical protein
MSPAGSRDTNFPGVDGNLPNASTYAIFAEDITVNHHHEQARRVLAVLS